MSPADGDLIRRKTVMPSQPADPCPHAPDVAERQTVDNGFSAGWGCQYLPSERYIVDVHTHCFGATDRYEIFRMLDGFFSRAAAFRLGRMVALDGSPENLESFAALARFDPRFRFWVRGDDEKPDLDFIKKAVEAGAVGMKILNIRIMRMAGDHKVWLSKPWQEIFAWLEGRKLPVLWHVTQRHTAAPYMGGNLLSYWSEGWKNGAKFTNEDLLAVFLENVKRFRGIPFIGPISCTSAGTGWASSLRTISTCTRTPVADASSGRPTRCARRIAPSSIRSSANGMTGCCSARMCVSNPAASTNISCST
jgi:hypothetical protein